MGRIDMSLYLKHLRIRYRRCKRKEKARILDEFCKTNGVHRKHAIRVLRQSPYEVIKKRGGRKKIYEEGKILEPLKRIWLCMDQICGKRLKAALPLWLPYYEEIYGVLSEEVKTLFETISAASIDRLLKPYRSKKRPHYGGTKPGSLLKKHIPIKTEQWNEKRLGFMEADTVAHCGMSLSGDFVWSLTLTDICSGWTENRAMWNKGSLGTLKQIKSIESVLPFEILGFDSDNGNEFLNYHLLRYLQDRSQPIQFSRSRPYKKDDNAHVEQKNWTHVRQIFGYYRFDNPRLVELMNDLYSNEMSLLYNYFLPCFKLVDKERVGTKIKKKHEKPLTPYQRLLKSEFITQEKKEELKKTFESLNPFALRKKMQSKLKIIFGFVDLQKKSKRTAI